MKDEQQASLALGSDGGIPLSQDTDYPPLLRELAELTERELRNIGIDVDHAAAMAETLVEHVRDSFGGQTIYVPKGDNMRQRRRRARMWAEFNGTNQADLVKKYGVCLQQVYRVLAIARAEANARQQPDLFASPANADR